MSELNLSIGTDAFRGAKDMQAALDVLKVAGIKVLDTAEMYDNNETDLGDVKAGEQGFIISTKNAGGWIPGGVKNLKAATEVSLGKLKLKEVDILYLHAPDRTLKPEEWVHNLDDLHKAGKFKRFGISNFSPAETRELHAYCKANNLVLPTVYQGNYNAVSRLIEDTLFPVLRELGIVFYAYSPMAGGFLAKSRKDIEAGTADGRFAPTGSFAVQLYNKMYVKPALLDGLDKWGQLAKAQGIAPAELAYRWVYYHSALKPEKGDFVLAGASKLSQISATVEGLKRGPLAPEVVKGIDEIWEIVKHDAIIDNFDDVNGDISGFTR